LIFIKFESLVVGYYINKQRDKRETEKDFNLQNNLQQLNKDADLRQDTHRKDHHPRGGGV